MLRFHLTSRNISTVPEEFKDIRLDEGIRPISGTSPSTNDVIVNIVTIVISILIIYFMSIQMNLFVASVYFEQNVLSQLVPFAALDMTTVMLLSIALFDITLMIGVIIIVSALVAKWQGISVNRTVVLNLLCYLGAYFTYHLIVWQLSINNLSILYEGELTENDVELVSSSDVLIVVQGILNLGGNIMRIMYAVLLTGPYAYEPSFQNYVSIILVAKTFNANVNAIRYDILYTIPISIFLMIVLSPFIQHRTEMYEEIETNGE